VAARAWDNIRPNAAGAGRAVGRDRAPKFRPPLRWRELGSNFQFRKEQHGFGERDLRCPSRSKPRSSSR